MKLDNLTDRQIKILDKLRPCSEAVREIKGKIALIKNAKEFTEEYKAQKINEVLKEQKAKYSNTLNKVIEELEGIVKIELEWEEKTDAAMLYDMMMFKEYFGTGNIQKVCELVTGSPTNKTYRQLFELNYDRAIEEARTSNDRNTALLLYETYHMLENLGVDQEVNYILTTLQAIRDTQMLYNGLEVMDGIVTKPVLDIDGINVGKVD